MRLTAALGTIKRELFKGNMFRGKYRYVKPVKQKDMKELEEEYKREERVMKLLLKPYLTLVRSIYLKHFESSYEILIEPFRKNLQDIQR